MGIYGRWLDLLFVYAWYIDLADAICEKSSQIHRGKLACLFAFFFRKTDSPAKKRPNIDYSKAITLLSLASYNHAATNPSHGNICNEQIEGVKPKWTTDHVYHENAAH